MFPFTFLDILTTGSTNPESTRTTGVSSKPHPTWLGEVEISREATLEDLKHQVLTLDAVADLPIAGVNFMRLRFVERKQIAGVLKENDKTLR